MHKIQWLQENGVVAALFVCGSAMIVFSTLVQAQSGASEGMPMIQSYNYDVMVASAAQTRDAGLCY